MADKRTASSDDALKENLAAPTRLMDYAEALAFAKAFTRDNPQLHSGSKERRELFEEQLARRHQFETAYNEWLRIRGAECDCMTSDDSGARSEREQTLAAVLLSTPAPFLWQTLQKFEVLDYILTKHGEASEGDMMVIGALASIKADILRQGIMRDKELAVRRSAPPKPLETFTPRGTDMLDTVEKFTTARNRLETAMDLLKAIEQIADADVRGSCSGIRTVAIAASDALVELHELFFESGIEAALAAMKAA